MKFYEKKRIKEEKLNLHFEPVHCEDIGLYVIGKYPRLKFGILNFSEELNWNKSAEATIRLTLLNLINNGVIEIIKVEDYSTYVFKLFKNYNINYCFRVVDIQLDKDLLSVLFYNTINEVNKNKHPDLFQYINEIIGKLMGNDNNYNHPQRSFLIKILRKYAKHFKWIELIKSKKLLGLVNEFNIKVEDIYIPRINMQHKSLLDIDNDLLRHDKNYRLFCRALHDAIIKSFRRRKNND